MSNSQELRKIEAAAGWFMPKGAFIAGGAITSAFSNQPISDVDYYFKSKEAFELAVEQAYDDGWWAKMVSDRSVTFVQNDLVIQLIFFEFFETAYQVFDAFDFTCCMGAYDIDNGSFVFHDEFLKHVAQRHLKFHPGTRFPVASLLRVHKYKEKGYRIGKAEMLRIMLRCQDVKIESWEDLARAVGGVYGESILDLKKTEAFSREAMLAVLSESKVFSLPEPKPMPAEWDHMLDYIEVLKKDPWATYDRYAMGHKEKPYFF